MLLARLTLVLAFLVVPASAHAAKQPDLALKSAAVADPVLIPGEKAKVSVVVQNKGKKTAKGAVVRFFLLPEKGKQKALRGKAKVGKVKRGKTKTVTGRAKLPGSLNPDGYRIRPCIDPKKTDARAKNDCAKPKKAAPIGVLIAPGGKRSVTPQIAQGDYQASGVISRDGGTLTAYSANFERLYTLIVPPGALARDQHIEIKPLSGVGGLPFAGGMIGGVQLEPAGLQFSRPAALVISGEDIAPRPGQVAFAYNGGGQDFRLSGWFLGVPDWVQASGYYDPQRAIVLPVEHFSGIGVAPATDIETARQLSYDGMEAEDRISQELAKELTAERDRQLRGEEGRDDLGELFGKALYDYLEQVVLPYAGAASFSDAMYERALVTLLGWERQRQLMGGDPDDTETRYQALLKQINKLMEIAWEKLIERAEKRCYAGDFSIIARIIPLERQRALMGGPEGGKNEFSAAFVRCFKFELRFKSVVTHKGEGEGFGATARVDETYELTGTAPLAIEGENLAVLFADLMGSGPLKYTVARHTGSGEVDWGFGNGTCTFTSTGNTRDGLLDVTQGGLGLAIDGNTVTRIAQPYLTIDLGDPQEEINSKCQGTAFGEPYSTDENEWERNFMRYWSAEHREERVNPERAEQDDPLNGPFTGPWMVTFEHARWPVSGVYTRDVSDPDTGSHVVDTWELVHTPPARPGG